MKTYLIIDGRWKREERRENIVIHIYNIKKNKKIYKSYSKCLV